MSEPQAITLHGVRVHNLQNVDVEIPLHQLTVVTGVSGAGKSSLVFDTLYAEAQRRYLQSFSAYTRQFLERFDKPDADYISDLPPAVAIRRRRTASRRSTVGTMTEIADDLRNLFARLGIVICRKCGREVRAHRITDIVDAIHRQPDGTKFMIAFPSQPDGDASEWASALREDGYVRAIIGGNVVRLDQVLPQWPEAETPLVVVDRVQAGGTAVERITESVETAWNRGGGRVALATDDAVTHFDQQWRCTHCDIPYAEPEPRLFHFNDSLGACSTCEGTGLAKAGKSKWSAVVCDTCSGCRLNEQALNVRLAGKTIADLCDLSIDEMSELCNSKSTLEMLNSESVLLDQMRRRISCLQELNAGYLRLSQSEAELSLSETVLVRLATATAAGMVNTLMVIEESGAGLHESETESLIKALRRLRDAGNTLVAVEHHPDVIRAADYVVDLGPDAGEKGGRVVYQGMLPGMLACEASITGDCLSDERMPPKSRKRQSSASLRYRDVEFPLGVLCVATGKNSSERRAFIEDNLVPVLQGTKKQQVHGAGRIDEVVWMDQMPLPRSARSCAATYIKVFDEIRQTFAATADAKIRNYGAGHFSFNQSGGRCERCEGQGRLTVDMQFLADVTTTCPECDGARFQPDVLRITVRNLSIAEVLNLTVREAFRFFRSQVKIQKRLKWLLDVGLEYLCLGQATDTLSGGECQRLKLAGHLSSTRKSRCLFVLIEPSAGLHLADVEHLLECFHRLVDEGHSLLIVDNHSELIAAADSVVEF